MNSRAPNEMGKKYGHWYVISPAPSIKNSKGNTRSRWLCKCECGIEHIVDGSALRSGDSKSCGCRRGDAKTMRAGGKIGMAYRAQKYNARQRGYDFSLSQEFVEEIFFQNCVYCAAAPEFHKTDNMFRSGLDRVNNWMGYHYGNIVPCCITCNRMKRDMDYPTFKAHIIAVAAKVNQ